MRSLVRAAASWSAGVASSPEKETGDCTNMPSCSMYAVGVALILVAVGYQYRNDITRLLARESSGRSQQPPATSARDKQPQRPLPVKPVEFTEEELKRASERNKPPPETEAPEYYNPPFDPEHPEELFSEAGSRLITISELAAHAHDGPLKPIWLAVAGRVYDVSKGKSYGSDGGYNFFTGRDGTRAFVTGEFNEEGLIDNIDGLSPLEIGEIDGWVKFYEKDYKFVGKLIGRYYQRDGSPTKAWYAFQKALGERDKIEALRKEQEQQFPPCNSHWTEKDGGTVWCGNKSGGIHRDWAGVPRRYFAPGSRSWRCACVNTPDLGSPHLKPYPGCKDDHTHCPVDKEKLAELDAKQQ